MGATRWTPSQDVTRYVVKHGDSIRGLTTHQLWAKSKFYTKKKLAGGMAGITFHKDKVMFSDAVPTWEAQRQASIIYHELVHVAQQLQMPQGWIGFMTTYLWQWIRSGFSYQKMKTFGLEKEAYARQYKFEDKIRNMTAP